MQFITSHSRKIRRYSKTISCVAKTKGQEQIVLIQIKFMSEFTFLPVTKGKKKNNGSSEIYTSLQKNGTALFTKTALLNLGIDVNKTSFVTIYADESKRALGFKFNVDSIKQENKKQVYMMKPTWYKGQVRAQLSIRSALSGISNIKMPSGRLYLKEYSDKYVGKIYYTKVPKQTLVKLEIKDEVNQL